MIEYIPYTYLIGWSAHNKWYYGAEYARNKKRTANPSNLWTVYFSSSKYVKQMRKTHGEPDIIEIRKTFSDADSCRLWEQKVMVKMRVIENDKWINKTDNIGFSSDFERNYQSGINAALRAITGKTYEEICGSKELALIRSRKLTEMNHRTWDNPEIRAKRSKPKSNTDNMKSAAKNSWSDPVVREKRAASMRGKKKTRRT